jgi:hypothetical protein
MAAAGLVEDQIALRLGGLDKNQLRRRYIEELKEGRTAAAAEREQAAAEELSRKERERLECVEASFRSHWYTKEFGNDLYGGTHTVEEALAWAKANGHDKWD